jgi:HEAT repeat protein
MYRALFAVALLYAMPAFAIFGIETDPGKIEVQWRKEKLEAVANHKDAKERAAAAQWLGGRKEPEVIAALAKALTDRDANVRQAAASGLWDSDKAAEPARAQLVAALDDADPNVVAYAAGALQAIGMKEAELVAARKRVFASPDTTPTARFLVSRNLIGQVPSPELLKPMVDYLERAAAPQRRPTTSRNLDLAEQAIARLVKTQDRALIAPLMDATRNAKHGQPVLLRALATFKPEPDGYTAYVVGFLESPDPKVRYAALGSLRPLTKEKDVAVWAPRAAALLRDPDSSVRGEALWALGSGAGLAAGEIDKVVEALRDPEPGVRRSAARAIGEMGDRNQAVPAAMKARVADAARAPLASAMESDTEADVRAEAKSALAKLGGGGAPASEAKAVVASAAPSSAGSEAGGMAVLRARKITFEESSFFRALSEQDVDVIRAFLDAGMSPKKGLLEMGPPMRVMLFSASACSSRERPTKADTKAAVKLLLDRGADPNGSDANGNTPLSEAASHGCDRELMKMLIKAGAKIDSRNKAGLTPFEMGPLRGPRRPRRDPRRRLSPPAGQGEDVRAGLQGPAPPRWR